MTLLVAFTLVVAAVLLAFVGVPLWVFAVLAALGLLALDGPLWLAAAGVAAAVFLGVPAIRRVFLSAPIGFVLRRLRLLPVLSETERTALEAGTVWVDGQLFSGKPDWEGILHEPYAGLTEAERAFLDGPVDEVCRMVDDWDVSRRQDLPPEVWAFLKEQGFFSLIIPKAHGGLAFSARGHAAVVTRLATRCIPLAVTVMVPNSLGPAELLVHYGTREQKDHHLPRLARGDDVPCFALTESEAGSDAGAMASRGVVFRGQDGELMLRLEWRKRYITLAAVSGLIGLAFQLEDPENLLGQGDAPGITCALIPSRTPGVVLGRRHDPLGTAFMNCPTEGRDVVVPLSSVIGGVAGCGQGWKMLMETLAAGRGISLPSLSVGSAKLVARVAGGYAAVRRQFGMPIGRFEGIQEPLARIAGMTYLMEAAQVFTCGAIDAGARPSVVSAIVKYHETELARALVRDGMDILGGAGISRGPRNLLANLHVAQPISITVEGANILTRTMIIFGQGAIRCHPCAYEELDALAAGDLPRFDRALWKHVRLVVRNLARAVLFSVTRGRLATAPIDGPAAPLLRRLSWASASFATLADVAMGTLGGSLKRREKLTGRFADILSWMFLATATIRRFEAEGRRAEDVPLLRFAVETALLRMQEAFDGILRSFPGTLPGALLRGPIALWSRVNPLGVGPSDALGKQAAAILGVPSSARDRLTAGVYLPSDPQQALGRLEHALNLALQAEPILARVKDAMRAGTLPKGDVEPALPAAALAGLVTAAEASLVRAAADARRDLVEVDSFPAENFAQHVPAPASSVPGGMR